MRRKRDFMRDNERRAAFIHRRDGDFRVVVVGLHEKGEIPAIRRPRRLRVIRRRRHERLQQRRAFGKRDGENIRAGVGLGAERNGFAVRRPRQRQTGRADLHGLRRAFWRLNHQLQAGKISELQLIRRPRERQLRLEQLNRRAEQARAVAEIERVLPRIAHAEQEMLVVERPVKLRRRSLAERPFGDFIRLARLRVENPEPLGLFRRFRIRRFPFVLRPTQQPERRSRRAFQQFLRKKFRRNSADHCCLHDGLLLRRALRVRLNKLLAGGLQLGLGLLPLRALFQHRLF